MAAKDEGPREDLEKKPSKVDLLRSGATYKLLDDVLKTFLLSDPDTIPAIRDHEEKAVFEIGDEGAASADAVDANWIFLMHYFSTFAGDGVPNASLFEDIFYLICRTYAIFPSQTRKKVQKDWAKQQGGVARSLCVHCYGLFNRAGGARTQRIQMLKDLIRKVAQDKHGGNYETAIQENSYAKPGDDEVEIGSSSGQDTHDQECEVVDDDTVSVKKVTITKEADPKNPDNMETVPMEEALDEELRAWYLTQDSHPPDWVLQKAPQLEEVHDDDEPTRRQAMKDRQPLLPGVPKLGESLEAQVASMMSGEAGDVDALQAQAKVRQAARDATKGLTDDGKEPKHTARKGKGRGRGKGRGKGAGKGNTEYDSTAADTNTDKKRKDAECSSEAFNPAMKKPKPDDAEQEAVDAPQDAQEACSTAAQPGKQQVEKADVGAAKGEEATPPLASDGKPKKTRAARPRPKLTGDELQTAWAVQEDELKKGGVPILEGFKGAQKSYTLPPRDPTSMSQIGVLWCNKNLYVKWAKNPVTGVNIDSYGGCTVSVLKRGGWKNAFELATFIAGWVDALPANGGK